jgi:hypothetical protein
MAKPNDEKTPKPANLFIKHCCLQKHQQKTKSISCLIISTAPKNVENLYHEDLRGKDFLFSLLDLESSLGNLSLIKKTLKDFIDANWNGSGEGVLDNIKIVLDIHGYNRPLKKVEEDFWVLTNKLKEDISGQEEDLAIFIKFAWPSEKFPDYHSIWPAIRTMPYGFRVMIIFLLALLGLLLAALLTSLEWTEQYKTLTVLLYVGIVLITFGVFLALFTLRFSAYFRDRERASNYGSFDTVEIIRWLEKIVTEDIIKEKDNFFCERDENFFGRINLSFIAHSMGCFVTTQAVRILSDVFDSAAIVRWKEIALEGPFGGYPRKDPSGSETNNDKKLQEIGERFTLKSLVLIAPDIPIWAIITGRSNYLKNSLRRFQTVYLFTNDADIVLRLLSTIANFFVFPSASLIGGYRLGNLTYTDKRVYGDQKLDFEKLGINAKFGNLRKPGSNHYLTKEPFCLDIAEGNKLFKNITIVDCTDYQDNELFDSNSRQPFNSCQPLKRRLSMNVLNNPIINRIPIAHINLCNYMATARIFGESHGGYFKWKFCLNLIYDLALYGGEKNEEKLNGKNKLTKKFMSDLEYHAIAWFRLKD